MFHFVNRLFRCRLILWNSNGLTYEVADHIKTATGLGLCEMGRFHLSARDLHYFTSSLDTVNEHSLCDFTCFFQQTTKILTDRTTLASELKHQPDGDPTNLKDMSRHTTTTKTPDCFLSFASFWFSKSVKRAWLLGRAERVRCRDLRPETTTCSLSAWPALLPPLCAFTRYKHTTQQTTEGSDDFQDNLNVQLTIAQIFSSLHLFQLSLGQCAMRCDEMQCLGFQLVQDPLEGTTCELVIDHGVISHSGSESYFVLPEQW